MAENRRTRVAYIIQKGKTFEKQITTLQVYLESPTVDPINANLRLNNITTLYKEYVRYNDELTALQADHPQLDVFYEIEARYYDVATAVNKLQRVEPTCNTGNITITERHETPKLPEIRIPTFDGSHDAWLTYKNKFVALVHARSDLSNLVKHTQLESSLTGPALAKISEFPPSEENYLRAWNALIESYDQKRLLVVEHLDKILDLQPIPKATAADLSMLIDKARQHLSMLEQLEAKPSEEIVIRILERCLPLATRSRWEEKLDLNTLPTLEEFYKFMQSNIFKLRSLERNSSLGRSNAKKRAGENLDKGPSKVANTSARSLVTTQNAEACIKCKESHRLYKCPAFQKLTISERWEVIKANKICRNCLWVHPFPCKSEKRCKKCERDHHTLLHSDKKANSSKEQGQTRNEPSQAEKKTGPSGAKNQQS